MIDDEKMNKEIKFQNKQTNSHFCYFSRIVQQKQNCFFLEKREREKERLEKNKISSIRSG